jgi:hypothetical protein
MNAVWLCLGSFLFGFFAWTGRIMSEVALIQYVSWRQRRKAIVGIKEAIGAAAEAVRLAETQKKWRDAGPTVINGGLSGKAGERKDDN